MPTNRSLEISSFTYSSLLSSGGPRSPVLAPLSDTSPGQGGVLPAGVRNAHESLRFRCREAAHSQQGGAASEDPAQGRPSVPHTPTTQQSTLLN